MSSLYLNSVTSISLLTEINLKSREQKQHTSKISKAFVSSNLNSDLNHDHRAQTLECTTRKKAEPQTYSFRVSRCRTGTKTVRQE